MARFNPKDIGKQKKPEVNDTTPYLKDTDQRWFSEVSELYPSTGMTVWNGEGYPPEKTIRKLATRYLQAAAVERVATRFLQEVQRA
jgi:hypothetical protein